MAFVYEKVSKKEAEKFNLDDLWNHYYEGAFICLPEEWFEHSWTVDREREIWFYDMSHPQQHWEGSLYLLHYKNRNIEMIVQLDSANSSALDDVPFIKNIDFFSAKEVVFIEEKDRSEYYIPPRKYGAKENFTDEESLKELKTIFKEALVSYLTEDFFELRPNHPNYILNCRW